MAGYECGMKLPILYTVDLSGNPAKCIHWSVDGHLGSSLAFRLWQGVRQWTCLHMSSGVTSSFLLGLYLGLGPLGHSIGVCSVIGGIAKQMSVALLALTEVSSCCVFRACNYFLSACYASRRYHLFLSPGPALTGCNFTAGMQGRQPLAHLKHGGSRLQPVIEGLGTQWHLLFSSFHLPFSIPS